ncbi:hypothetical protein ACFX19_027798 [Malus domestica]
MAVARLSTTMLTLIPCSKRIARRVLARQSPTGKQKPDSSPQPAPISQGSCVLVGQEVIPDGYSCHEQDDRDRNKREIVEEMKLSIN